MSLSDLETTEICAHIHKQDELDFTIPFGEVIACQLLHAINVSYDVGRSEI